MKVWGIVNVALLLIFIAMSVNALLRTADDVVSAGAVVSTGMIILCGLEALLLAWYLFLVRKQSVPSTLDADVTESQPVNIPKKYRILASIMSLLFASLAITIISALVYIDNAQPELTVSLQDKQFRFFMLFLALYLVSLVVYNLRSAFKKNQHVLVAMQE